MVVGNMNLSAILPKGAIATTTFRVTFSRVVSQKVTLKLHFHKPKSQNCELSADMWQNGGGIPQTRVLLLSF